MLIEPNSPAPKRSGQDALDPSEGEYPDNPVLVRCSRGGRVESVHRGAWALVAPDGTLIDSRGQISAPIFARSSTKALQALPLIETGAADQLGFSTEELALALASHYGEVSHTRVVAALLQRLELDESALLCGAHRPMDHDAAFELRRDGHKPSTLHNNCSGKHAGFLALAKHLGDPVESYIDPKSRTQQLVREAVLQMSDCEDFDPAFAFDGCSAPTFRMPLEKLALAFARFANPDSLGPRRALACERLADAVARFPELIGGSKKQICTAIARATGGRLFPKIGAEAVYVIGDRGGDRALAIKMDDGTKRGLHAVILNLLRRFDLASAAELDRLAEWAPGPVHNYAGLEVGRTEVTE